MPAWWLDLLNQIVDARLAAKKTTLTELGRDLAREAGRSKPWDHGSVGRFLRGQNTTREMAEAFAEVFEIPGPIFRARSQAEALELNAVKQRYDTDPKASHKAQRKADAESVLSLHNDDAQRAGRALVSQDEPRGPTGRRSRRAG